MPRMPLPSGRLALALLALAAPCLAAEPDPRLAGYRTPPGWKVELAATEPTIVNPVTMTFGPDGRLYVVEWKEGRGPNDRILALTDGDGDGTFDRSEVYMDGLDLPAGVLFWDGWTYVTLDHDVVRMKDRDGDGKFEVREAIVTGFGNDDSHHRVSGMALGPDGWLYLTTGDSDAHPRGSDGSKADVLRCGGVFRCRPDGSRVEVVAFGLRNPWGNVAFDDEFRIFHTDNDNEGAPGFTGCRLLHIVEGGDYGWRLREGARCCQPDFERATWNGGRPGRLGWMAETGRGAPAGLCVLNSAAFPPSTRNLLVYPDVFRKSVRAYRTKAEGASYSIGEEFVLLASDEGLFRPTDAEIGPDGALYILDWRTDSGGAGKLSGNGKTGRIYRMTWSGTADEPARPTLPRERLVGLAKADEPALVAALADPDHTARRAASLELIRRGPQRPEVLARVVADRSAPAPARRHALAALSATSPAQALATWRLAAADPAPALRRLAVECARRFLPIGAADSASRRALVELSGLLDGGREDDPQVLRERLLALGHACSGEADAGPSRQAAAALLERAEALPASDPFLRDAATRALEALGPVGLRAVVAAMSSGDRGASAAATFALQGWRGRDGLEALLDEATGPARADAASASGRLGLFRALREMGAAVPPARIAGWLEHSEGSPDAVRAEAIRLLAAMGPRGAGDAAPILPALLTSSSEPVRRAALDLAEVARSSGAEPELVALAQGADRPAEERRQALAALRGYGDKALIPAVAGLADRANDPGVRVEALRTLAPLDFDAAAKLARAALDSADPGLRLGAIALLGQKPDTALEVVGRFESGKLPREDLSAVIEAARPHPRADLKAAVAALLKRNTVADAGLKDAKSLRELVSRGGDPARGRAIFLDSNKAVCTSCHRLEGVGNAVGPDLTRVWETLSFDKRLESILEPSKEIKEGYATTKVATTDGRVFTGLLLSSNAQGIALKDAQGREVRIAAGDVEQKAEDPVSLMPEGLVSHLTAGELADLLAFLGDRPAQESLRPGTPAARR